MGKTAQFSLYNDAAYIVARQFRVAPIIPLAGHFEKGNAFASVIPRTLRYEDGREIPWTIYQFNYWEDIVAVPNVIPFQCQFTYNDPTAGTLQIGGAGFPLSRQGRVLTQLWEDLANEEPIIEKILVEVTSMTGNNLLGNIGRLIIAESRPLGMATPNTNIINIANFIGPKNLSGGPNQNSIKVEIPLTLKVTKHTAILIDGPIGLQPQTPPNLDQTIMNVTMFFK